MNEQDEWIHMHEIDIGNNIMNKMACLFAVAEAFGGKSICATRLAFQLKET